MNDVNYIKGQLNSWRQCINWLEEKYPEKKFELDHKLQNVKGISYEEKQGGGSSDESMRRSVIIDQLNELESEKEHCESVVAFCERIVKRVKPEWQDVFIYRFKHTYVPVSRVAYLTGFESASIYSIIDRETERLANE